MANDLTLADAIIYHDVNTVYGLIESGVEINDLDEYGYTHLAEATMFDQWDMAALLLKKGAKVNDTDLTGRTALHWAADNNNLRLAKLLLQHEANPNAYSKSGQPVLTFPLLRGHHQMKHLLLDHGASLDFTLDFIQAKLIGHRYELRGRVHLITPAKRFFLLDYEGFFLEFTLAVIFDSLKRYRKNYAAKHMRHHQKTIDIMANAMLRGLELIQYQHHTPLYKQHEATVDMLLDHPLIFIPVGYEGHAISCISYGNYWVKIDRGWNSKLEGSVVIYQVTRPEYVNKSFFKHLLYNKHSRDYVNEGLNQALGLVQIAEMALPAQVIGNCSWANVEGSIAAMLFLLQLNKQKNYSSEQLQQAANTAFAFFEDWREWDKDRALEQCFSDFHHSEDPSRKASKAVLMAAVLAQTCDYRISRHLKRAEKILSVLVDPHYRFALDAYIKILYERGRSALGANLMNLLDLAAPKGLTMHLVEGKLEIRTQS